jgi:hypothetical protein
MVEASSRPGGDDMPLVPRPGSLLSRATAALPGAKARRNKAVVLQMLDAFNEGKPEIVKQFFHPEYREDTAMARFPLDPSMDTMAPPERVRSEIKLVKEAFPDMRYSIKELVAEGELVVLIWEFTGTHSGDFFGIKATNEKTSVRGYEVVEFRNGLMVRHFDNHPQTTVEVMGQVGMLDSDTLTAHGLKLRG